MEQLRIYLGDSVAKEKVYLDFNQISHLIIAGTVAAGKTIAIHRMIDELSSHCAPEQVGFVLIDPKYVEMRMWCDLPHLVFPIAMGRKNGQAAIETLYGIMQERIAGHAPTTRHIFVMIDELADFVVGESADKTIDYLSEVLETGSKVNIHLIGATQGPSWFSKPNKLSFSSFPYRLVGRFFNKMDSKRFLGNGDASELHSGDMFLLTPTEKTRLHIPFFVKDE